MSDLVTKSDVSAAAIGALFGYAHIGHYTLGMQSALAFVSSVVARMVSSSQWSQRVSTMSSSNKNIFLVGAINAVYAYMKKRNMLNGALVGVSVDVVSVEVLKLMSMDDTVLWSMNPNTVGS